MRRFTQDHVEKVFSVLRGSGLKNIVSNMKPNFLQNYTNEHDLIILQRSTTKFLKVHVHNFNSLHNERIRQEHHEQTSKLRKLNIQ